MLPNGSLGSKAVRLRMNTCFPVCARKRTYLPILDLLPPPTFRERGHGGLARHLVAVHRLTIFVGQDGPQPRRSNWGRCCFHDSADNSAISKHVEVVVIPLTGWAARRSAFED